LCAKLPESNRGLLIYTTNEHEVKNYLVIILSILNPVVLSNRM
jgi:hypothetical protein